MAKLKLPAHVFKQQVRIADKLVKTLKDTNPAEPTDSLNNTLYIIKSAALFLECSPKFTSLNMTAECADFMAWGYEALKKEVSYAYKPYKTTLPLSIYNEYLHENDNYENNLTDKVDKLALTQIKSDISLDNYESKHIDRLTKIFLLNYDISYFNCEIKDGWVIFISSYFTIHAVLCGELSDPKWKIIKTLTNVRGITEDVFSSIQELGDVLNFVEYYESCKISKDLHKEIIKLLKSVELVYKLTGDYNNCTLVAYDLILRMKIVDNKFRFCLNDEYFDDNYYNYFRDQLKACIDTKLQDTKAKFNFKDGIMYKGSRITLLDIESIVKTEREDDMFNRCALAIQNYSAIRNWSDVKFGSKNIFVHDYNNFVCFRIDNCKLFCGKVNQIENCKELYVCYSDEDAIKKNKVNESTDVRQKVKKGNTYTGKAITVRKAMELEPKHKQNIYVTNNPNIIRAHKVDYKDFIDFFCNNIDALIESINLYRFNLKIDGSILLSCKIRNFLLFCKMNGNYVQIKCAQSDLVVSNETIKNYNYENTNLHIDDIKYLKAAIKYAILKEKTKEAFNVYSEDDYKMLATRNNLQFTVTFKNKMTLSSPNQIFENLIYQSLNDVLYFVELTNFLLRFLNLEIFPLSLRDHTVAIPTFHLLKKDLQIAFVRLNMVYLRNSKKMIDICTHKNFFNAIHTIFTKNRFVEIKHHVCKTFKLINCFDEDSKIYASVDWQMTLEGQNKSLSFRIILKESFDFEFLDSKYECLNNYVKACLKSYDYYLTIFDFICTEKIGKLYEKINKQ